MEMNDLGKKYPTTSPASEPPSSPGISYPCLYGLDSERLPGLDQYNPGDEIMLHVKGVVKSKSLHKIDEKKTEDITIELTEGAIMHDSDRKMSNETGMTTEQVKARKAKYS
jgi:hypothetical protein